MRTLILITTILLFLSCAAQAPATGGPKDIHGPELISVSPADASAQIEVDTKIIFEFNETVDPTSVTSSISILNFDDFIIKSRRNKVIIEPHTTWPKNNVFELNLSRRIRDYQNNIMARGHQFIFSTGENIPEGQKSIAINVTIQSSEKTLNDDDLEKINQLIISTVELKTGAKIRS